VLSVLQQQLFGSNIETRKMMDHEKDPEAVFDKLFQLLQRVLAQLLSLGCLRGTRLNVKRRPSPKKKTNAQDRDRDLAVAQGLILHITTDQDEPRLVTLV